ncbi:MAG: SPOR domain-containing protein [Gammaproteobacteria bacterium]
MAESKKRKKQSTPDQFADDLDSMLNPVEDAVGDHGLIDDDDVIDRLLMNDSFSDDTSENAPEPDEIDRLISAETANNSELLVDFDEFGDDADEFFSDVQMNSDDRKKIAQTPATPNYGGVESNTELGENRKSGQLKENRRDDDLEKMTEIDELSDESNHDSDFLLADFDISPDHEEADDDAEPLVSAQAEMVGEAELDEAELFDEFGDDQFDSEDTGALSEDAETTLVEYDLDSDIGLAAEKSGEVVESGRIDELAGELANITEQIEQLVKHQHQLKQQLHLKCAQESFNACLEEIEELRSEQKKARRSLEGVWNRKPTSAYVANVVAALALLIGLGLGIQGYIAKVQLAELADYLGKMKDQINANPKNHDLERDAINKRLDELVQADATMSGQIVELNKSMLGENNDFAGELGKKLDQLNQQDMQMGATIESLQHKLDGLEKRKISEATKPSAKQVTVRENWAVNLVAFKQDWYAKRKAEEFASKGIPAKVNKVDSKGEIWYRLVVDGFSSEYEAAAYAARVKKTLNLDSVWLAKVKK